MSAAPLILGAAAAVAVAAARRRRDPSRPSWDVPAVQRQQADRILEAAALYRAGRDGDARIALRDRALDWGLIARAASARPLDPVAHRIGAAIGRDGSGMFLGELHSRLAPADRERALATLAQALLDYTGPADEGAR